MRQARHTRYPDPVQAAYESEMGGADSITIHLREDRRHIQERDLALLMETVQTRVNLEMAVTEEMVAIAERYCPQDCCLVPERREELTTEGGLDVVRHEPRVRDAIVRLKESGCRVSLFINADRAQVDAAIRVGAPAIEIHTGLYAEAESKAERGAELARIIDAAQHGYSQGLSVHAGHGLHYFNVQPVAAIAPIIELNIGHAIVARALFCGLRQAVSEMKRLMIDARA